MTDSQLESYRASIDNIDAALVHLLAERFKVTQAVGRYKADRRPSAGRSRTRGAADRPPADPRRGVGTRPRLHRVVPPVHRLGGDPPPRASRRRARRAIAAGIRVPGDHPSGRPKLRLAPALGWGSGALVDHHHLADEAGQGRLYGREEAGERVEAHATELQGLGVERLQVERGPVAGLGGVAALQPDPLADLVRRSLSRPAEVAVELVGAVGRIGDRAGEQELEAELGCPALARVEARCRSGSPAPGACRCRRRPGRRGTAGRRACRAGRRRRRGSRARPSAARRRAPSPRRGRWCRRSGAASR